MAEPTTPPSLSSAASPTARRSALPALAVVLSLAALGVSASQPWWAPRVFPPAAAPLPDTSQTEALAEKLQRLADEVATLKLGNEVGPTPATTAELKELHDRLAIMEASLKTASAASDSLKAVTAALDEVKAKQAKSETANTAGKTLLVATLQLVTAWQTGLPFGAPWTSALAAAEADNPALAAKLNDIAPVLLPWRDRGLPTLAALTTDFAPAARAAIAAAAPPAAGWIDQTLNTAKGLVTIRRVGAGVSGESAEAVLARAEAQLALGNLASAVNELDALPETAADAMANWLTAARARVKAEKLGADLATLTANSLLPAAP